MMATSAQTLFEVSDATPRIGAVIRADKAALLSGDHAARIREIMEQRGVILFPEIHMTDAEQIAFTHTLGTFAHEASEQAGRDGDFVVAHAQALSHVAGIDP